MRIGSGLEPVTYINGTQGSRITFDKYDFSAASSSSQRPEFQLFHVAKSSDWVWDAAKNLWYWPYPQAYEVNNLTWGAYPRVTIDGQLCQVVRFESATFIRGNEPSGPLEVCAWQVSTPGRLYLWTPNASSDPSTNPTAYYGSRIFASSTSVAIFQFNRCGSYVDFKNLSARNSGALVSPYNDSSSAGDITSFAVQYCHVSDCGTMVVSNMVDSTKNIDGLTIANNTAENLVGGAFMGGAKNLLIKGNTIKGVNLGRSDGGAFYLVGSYPGMGGIVEDNVISDARYETGGCLSDGCAIYAEAGSLNLVIRRNEIFNSPLAMQDNSGRNNTWYANYIHDCDKGITITDQSNLASTPSNIKVYQNTFQNIGMNKLYKAMPAARFAAIACRKGTPAASNYTWEFVNNVLLGDHTSLTSGYGLLVETGTNLVTLNNAVSGFGGGVKADEYSKANVTTPATTITQAPQLKSDGTLSAASPCRNAGNKHGNIWLDKNKCTYKMTINEAPSVGAFEYEPLAAKGIVGFGLSKQ